MRFSEKIRLSRDTLELIHLLITLLSTFIGLFLSQFKEIRMDIALIGAGLVGIIAYEAYKAVTTKKSARANPYLIIEHDEISLHIDKDKRTLEQRLHLRALKKATTYRFKFYWTGSLQGLKVECDQDKKGGALKQLPYLPDTFLTWLEYEFQFDQLLEPDKTTFLLLRYTLPDPHRTAHPYHMVSYGHVKRCERLTFRLSFAEKFLSSFSEETRPNSVRCIERDQNRIPLKFEKLASEGTHQYITEPAIKLDHKYSIEWRHEETDS